MTETRAERRERAVREAGAVASRAWSEAHETYLAAGAGPEGALAVGQAAHPRDPERAAAAADQYLAWAEENRAEREPGAA